MYKTAVYTLVNGVIQGRTHRKQQKNIKNDIARNTLTVCKHAAE